MIRLRHNNEFFFTLYKTTNRQLKNMTIISPLLPRYARTHHYHPWGTTIRSYHTRS